MKTLLLILTAALVLAGAATTSPAAPPASLPDGPDLSAMALRAADFGGGRVDGERYTSSAGALAAYERDLVLRGRLLGAGNEVFLYRTPTLAQQQVGPLRRLLSGTRGRQQFALELRRALAPLKVRSVTVSPPTTIAAGNAAFWFSARLETKHGRLHLAMSTVRLDRAVGFVWVLGAPGKTVPAAMLPRVTRTQAARFRTGFTVRNVMPPLLTGTAAPDQQLFADRGRWAGGPTQLSYQWRRCDAAGLDCVDVPGATGTSYRITPDDVGSTLVVRVRARNALSTAVADSPGMTVAPPPEAEPQP